MIRYLVLLSVVLASVSGCRAVGAPANLLADGGFNAIRAGALGRWEVRFALKASDPASRPRWQAVPRVDQADALYGPHLSLEKTGPASGTVYLGQRVRLPEPLPELELSLDFQAFCEMAARSGSVALVVVDPEAWRWIAADPEKAGAPPEAFLFQQEVHRNREDVTAWERGGAAGPELRKALAPLAGREVVVAVAWNTWHPGSKEWARFDNLWLGPPRPSIAAEAWPRWAYRGEALALRVTATGDEGAPVVLRFREAGTQADWRELPMAGKGDGRFEATLPAAALAKPLEARAALRRPGEAEVVTPVREIGMTQRPEHPNLYYSKAELARMREKTGEFDWARAIFEGLKREADAWVGRAEDPPAEPGGWSHDYCCPEDGARLRFRRDQPLKHLCPSCSKEWEGPKLDAVWRANLHGDFAGAASDLALVYQLTGEERYGRAAARILLWYADHYAGFPLGKGPAGKGRVMSQSLSECTWLITMMRAADLAWPALTPEERVRVERDLVRAGAEHIHHYTFGIHNIQCWHNACYASAGYFLGDPDMVREARDGDLGLKNQVEKGIMEDGMWFERSLGYHGYTLNALVTHCEAARHAGEDLYKLGRIRLMFTLPLRLAQPNLVVPSLNDQGYSHSPIGTEGLERAVAWYGDADAARALRMLLDRGAKRSSLTALQYGEALPEVGAYEPPGSANLPGAGMAVLRRGKGDDALCAMVEYGDHGGGHGHPDKLQLILYGLGRTLCPDLGTTGYGVPLHGQWYKTTPSHNTVTLGGKSQARTEGKLLAFEVKEGYSAATAESTGAYPGCRLLRRLLLTDDFLVDVFSVIPDAGQPAVPADWFLRVPGALALGLEAVPLREEAPNATYGYLKDLRAGETAGEWTATWDVDGKGSRLQVTMAGAPGTQVARCLAPGIAGEAPWQTLRVRRNAGTTVFAAVYQTLPPGRQAAPVAFADDAITIGGKRVALGETALSIR